MRSAAIVSRLVVVLALIAILCDRPMVLLCANGGRDCCNSVQLCHQGISRRMASAWFLPVLGPIGSPGLATALDETVSNRVNIFLGELQVFAVTNPEGSPAFEQDSDAPDGRAGHFYFTRVEAEEALRRVGGKVGDLPLEVRELPLSDVYLPLIIDGNEQELGGQLRMVPLRNEVRHARQITSASMSPDFPSGAVPLFNYPDLELESRTGETCTPLYLQENDLLAMVTKAGGVPDRSRVSVTSLQNIVSKLRETEASSGLLLRLRAMPALNDDSAKKN